MLVLTTALPTFVSAIVVASNLCSDTTQTLICWWSATFFVKVV